MSVILVVFPSAPQVSQEAIEQVTRFLSYKNKLFYCNRKNNYKKKPRKK